VDDDCNHIWKYIGSKYQAAWVCSHCQALRTSEPPAIEWKGLTDEERLAIVFDAKITEPNDEPIKFGAPSRKCIQDLISHVEAKLKEKNTHATKPNQDLCGND
jgi:hypothetical protein